jgi:hypothetical protein
LTEEGVTEPSTKVTRCTGDDYLLHSIKSTFHFEILFSTLHLLFLFFLGHANICP